MNTSGSQNARRNACQRGKANEICFSQMEAAKREDRANMKKEAKLLMCTLLNGSAWSTERKGST